MTAPTDKPTLREQLDAVRPDSDDLSAEDLQRAALAVEESEHWQDLLVRQQAVDRVFASAMQDVDVPEDLQSRLLESLADARAEAVASTPTGNASAPPTRRGALKWTAMVAGLSLAVGLGWLIWSSDGSQISLEYARHNLLPTTDEGVISLAKLWAFDDSFAFALPDAEWRRRTLMAEELKGLDWTGDGKHDGAVYAFQVGGRIRGYLLVLPASRLVAPPSATRLSTLGIDYQPVTNTAWVDSTTDLVYICFVDRGDLEALYRALYPHAA